jgi:hypothetical protein
MNVSKITLSLILSLSILFSGCANQYNKAKNHADKIGGIVTRFSDTKSMLPVITAQSVGVALEVNERTDYSIGDIVIFRESDGRFICHRVIDIQGNLLLIKGDSAIYEDGWLNKDLMWFKVVAIY